MIRRFLYKRNGEYWGFIYLNRVYDKNNNYKGWVEDDKFVWDENGKYMGELVEDIYILKNKNDIGQSSKLPQEKFDVNFKKISKKNKIGKIQLKGWIDALK